jgi:hypothetical protein
MEKLDKIKRRLGFLWMLLGPLAIIGLVIGAFQIVSSSGTSEINQPLPWIIMITIFTPVAIGLSIFGWYAWKGEYDGEIKT